jgi:hypothetical protein
MARMILGSRDRCGDDTASTIPNSEFMLIDGMGHDLPHALYGAVAKAIDQIARNGANSGRLSGSG